MLDPSAEIALKGSSLQGENRSQIKSDSYKRASCESTHSDARYASSSLRLFASSRSASADLCLIQLFMFSIHGRRSSSRFVLLLASAAPSPVLRPASPSINAPSTSRGCASQCSTLRRSQDAHRPFDRVEVHLEHLEMVKGSEVGWQGTDAVALEGQHFEVRQSSWGLGKDLDLILREVKDFQ